MTSAGWRSVCVPLEKAPKGSLRPVSAAPAASPAGRGNSVIVLSPGFQTPSIDGNNNGIRQMPPGEQQWAGSHGLVWLSADVLSSLQPSGCVRPSGCRFRSFQNCLVIEIEKAPQVGLEPTTLRLTAGSNNYCLVLPRFASSCFLVLSHRKQTNLLLASICRILL